MWDIIEYDISPIRRGHQQDGRLIRSADGTEEEENGEEMWEGMGLEVKRVVIGWLAERF